MCAYFVVWILSTVSSHFRSSYCFRQPLLTILTQPSPRGLLKAVRGKFSKKIVQVFAIREICMPEAAMIAPSTQRSQRAPSGQSCGPMPEESSTASTNEVKYNHTTLYPNRETKKLYFYIHRPKIYGWMRFPGGHFSPLWGGGFVPNDWVPMAWVPWCPWLRLRGSAAGAEWRSRGGCSFQHMDFRSTCHTEMHVCYIILRDIRSFAGIANGFRLDMHVSNFLFVLV